MSLQIESSLNSILWGVQNSVTDALAWCGQEDVEDYLAKDNPKLEDNAQDFMEALLNLKDALSEGLTTVEKLSAQVCERAEIA